MKLLLRERKLLTGPESPWRSVCAPVGSGTVSENRTTKVASPKRQTTSAKETSMWFRSLFDTLLALSPRTRAQKRHLAPRFRRRFHSFPRLEILEERTLLSANIYVVNLAGDAGTGSGLTGDIRYCITQADDSANAGSTITFDTAKTGYTIMLSQGELVISDTMTITGPGSSLTITENTYSRLFDVAFGESLTLEQLTLSGGVANGGDGGAIFDTGTLALSGVTVTGNQAWGINGAPGQPGVPGGNGGDAYGGGIYVGEGSVTLSNDTFSSNNAVGGQGGGGSGPYTGSGAGNGGNGGGGSGGGLYVAAGSVTLTNDTFSGNNAVGGIGGIGGSGGRTGYGNNTGFGGNGGNGGGGSGGGLYASSGSVTLNDVTVSSNNASGGNGGAGGSGLAGGSSGIGGAAFGGGMDVVFGNNTNVLLYNTLVAADLAGGNPSDIQGSLNSASSYNIIGDGSGGISTANYNLLGSSTSPLNPLLAPLSNNGGPTQTMALLSGSPAIAAGDTANAPAYDQRGAGFPRLVGGKIDIGAFEVQSQQLSSFWIGGFPASIGAGSAGTFVVIGQYAGGSTDTSYTGTVHFTSSDSQAGLPADYTFTSTDAGVHIFSAILKTAGTQSITVQDTATSINGSQSGIVVIPAAATSFSVSGFPSAITAGLAGGFSVTAIDPFGNTATGYSGTVHFTSSDAKAVLPADYTFQSGDQGVHSFLATLKTAGTQSITVTDPTPGFSGSDAGITVNPAAASQFIFRVPARVQAGVAFSLTLRIEDIYGNVVTGYIGTIHFSSTDTTATLPKNYTFTAADKGVHTFTGLVLRKKGYQRITLTDTHNRSLTGSIVEDVL
jgi:hypothetical protein